MSKCIARYRLRKAIREHTLQGDHLLDMHEHSHGAASKAHEVYMTDLWHRAHCEYRCSDRLTQLLNKYL